MKKIKKILICIFIIMVSLCLISCGTDGWNTVEIDGYGSVKVPQNWTEIVIDEFQCFSYGENGNSKEVLTQYRNDTNINERFFKIEELIWLEDENFSNSASISKYQVCYTDGSSEEMFVLCFTGSGNYESTEFLCLDSSVSESTLKKIAKSYQMK